VRAHGAPDLTHAAAGTDKERVLIFRVGQGVRAARGGQVRARRAAQHAQRAALHSVGGL